MASDDESDSPGPASSAGDEPSRQDAAPGAEPQAAGPAGGTSRPPAAAPADAPPGGARAAARPVALPADAAAPPDALEELPPDHPLLQRAQQALFQQLSATKLRLEEELREQRQALKDAKAAREQVGVELYGFQQHLAKLQLSLERSSEARAAVAAERAEADAELRSLRAAAADEEAVTAAQRARVGELQGELDRLADTLRQIGRHNEAVAGEAAVAKRAAEATEGQVQRLERTKQEQDFLIDGLQQQLRRLGRQLELHSGQLEAQRAEKRAAQEFLARAVSDMEGVQFEKKQLVSQWRSSLLAMKRRDEALELIQDAMQQQAQQRASIMVEMERYRKDLAREQQRNEQRAAVLQRLEGQAQYLGAQIEKIRSRQGQLQTEHAVVQQQLAVREAELATASEEGRKLAGQKQELDRQFVKANQSIQALEQQLLDRLAEQTSAEKGAQRTVRDTKALRVVIQQKEGQLQELQAQLARTQTDYDGTQARNAQLAATLQQLDRAISERSAGIAALEADMKRRNVEIEQKTRDIDGLNRRLLKLTEKTEGAETGPLEATIVSLQREIDGRTKEGRALQRRWVVAQGQLVGLQAENAELAEGIVHMRAQQAVLQHKRQRLSQQLHQQETEIAALGKALAGLHAETGRLNALLAETTGLHTSLHEDNLLLEARATNQLKDLEEQWAALQSQIGTLRAEKKEIVAAVVEAEREVLVAERRIQLEREMQDAIDPTYGNEASAELRKEISRLQHRYGDLLREQERLVGEMERAVLKREVISVKGRASQGQRTQDMTVAQLKKSAADLQKGIAQAERERRAVEARLAQLGQDLAGLEAGAQEAGAACGALREAQVAARAGVEALGLERYKALVDTQAKQKEAKRYEDGVAGRYKLHAADPVALAAELERAKARQERVRAVVEGLAAATDELQPQLRRVLAHAGPA